MSQLKVDSIVPSGGVVSGAEGGGIIQVVSENFTSKVSTSGNGWTTLTGFSATITPRSTSNKILVMVKIGVISSNYGDVSGAFRIQRGGTTILQGASTGNSRDRASFRGISGVNNDHGMAVGMNGIDSPASTSSLTYTVDCNPQDGTIFCINQEYNSNNNGDSYSMNVMSNITLFEVCN